MSESQKTIFYILLVAIVILSLVIVFLLKKIEKQKLLNQSKIDKQLEERIENILESINVISLAVIQDQCELSEGCWRIKRLLDLQPIEVDKEKTIVFNKMFREIKNFATHEKRNELKLAEVVKQDRLRKVIEQKYQNDLIAGCEYLYELTKK